MATLCNNSMAAEVRISIGVDVPFGNWCTQNFLFFYVFHFIINFTVYMQSAFQEYISWQYLWGLRFMVGQYIVNVVDVPSLSGYWLQIHKKIMIVLTSDWIEGGWKASNCKRNSASKKTKPSEKKMAVSGKQTELFCIHLMYDYY